MSVRPLALAALLLLAGCYESHTRGNPPDAPDAALTPDAALAPDAAASDAGPPPMRVCPSAASLGPVRERLDVVTTFAGCDDRCIVVHQPSGPDLDREALEAMRERVAAIGFTPDVEVAPCCPSRPEAGLCLVVRDHADPTTWPECGGEPVFHPMWMLAVAEGPGCFAVRVER